MIIIFGAAVIGLPLLFAISFIFDWPTKAKVFFGSLALITVGSAIVIPNFVRARVSSRPPGGHCINNLRQIDGAKEQVFLERAYKGAEPTAAEIARYIKGQTIPKCPGGGVYRLGTAEEKPSCSKHGALTK